MSGELSMDQVLLKKLHDVLEINFEKELFGVKELTEEMGMSRAKLHRKLHTLTGKSTSQFIREYRLEKAMQMLQNNVATASEIAYSVGFNSPTYFNTSFHEYYGFTPGEVKYKNPTSSEKNETVETSAQFDGTSVINKTTQLEKKSRNQKIIMIYLLGLLLIVAFSYYFYLNAKDTVKAENKETVFTDKSIAIIPFKNLSQDKEDEFFTKGVMESLQNHLNKIVGLKVISDRSMEQYHNTTKTASEIANEVNVSYLLDGSVQKHADSVRIITHLINAKEDLQLASFVFDWEFKNIFTIQSNIAKQIAEELDITLSPLEIEQIEKKPTNNSEAYSLWLQGNFQALKYTKNGWENAISLYAKAIALDSSFIEAYVNQASSWLYGGAIWGSYSEQDAWRNAKQLLQKANQLDNTNPEIKRALLDGSYLFDWNFVSMEKEYENSTFPFLYEIQTGRYGKSLASINKMIETDPTNGFSYAFKAQVLFYLNRKDEAIRLLNRYDAMFSDNLNYLRESSKYYFYMGEYVKSKVLLDKLMTNFPDRAPITLWLSALHQDMEGNKVEVQESFNALLKKYEDGASGSPAWFIALYYCTKRDYENAFKWLQRSFDRHETEMMWLREEPLLIPLRNDKRYKKLYKKVGFPMKPYSYHKQD